MKLLTDYHTHTIYSRLNHGKGTIRENVEEARRKGLREIWITDHGPGHLFFGVDRKKLGQMRDQVDQLNREYEDIEVYLGLEANIIGLDGSIDVKDEDLFYLDGLNLGFHTGVLVKDIKTFFHLFIINPLAKFIKPLRGLAREKNTQALIKAIEKNKIQLITHPSDKYDLDLEVLARACLKRETALEVNSSHGHLSVEDLRLIDDSQVMLAVGSDAHSPDRVGDLRSALDRIDQAGIDGTRIVNLKEI